MDNFINQLIQTLSLMKANASLAFLLICMLWGITLLNAAVRYRLNILGIYPRSLLGTPGIFFHSFLHADFNHLFFNSIPLFVLMDFVLMEGVRHFIIVTLFIILVSGFAIWLFARRGIHLGASSLVSGYFGYLLFNAYQHPSVTSILLAIICVYYFGGILAGLFPQEDKVSWEGHLFGFLAGLAAALINYSFASYLM